MCREVRSHRDAPPCATVTVDTACNGIDVRSPATKHCKNTNYVRRPVRKVLTERKQRQTHIPRLEAHTTTAISDTQIFETTSEFDNIASRFVATVGYSHEDKTLAAERQNLKKLARES